jgi:uncharacterized protein YraI
LVLWLALGMAVDRAWALEGDRTYRVVGVEFDDVLNIRAGPSAGYPIIGEIPPTGRGVRVVGECYVWCPIRYNGAAGWVHARYLAAEPMVAPFVRRATPVERPSEPAATPPLRAPSHLPAYWRVTGVAAADGLRVHGEPSANAPVVHVFEPQAACIKLAGGCQKPWCQVKFPTGGGDGVGWVDSKHLAPASGACGR